jgi:hypothetical protein
MKKVERDNLDDYELFYLELPQADYLKDIEIQDEHENADYDQIQGLSSEQVSEIARDSLDAAQQQRHSSDDQKKDR